LKQTGGAAAPAKKGKKRRDGTLLVRRRLYRVRGESMGFFTTTLWDNTAGNYECSRQNFIRGEKKKGVLGGTKRRIECVMGGKRKSASYGKICSKRD